MTEIDLPRHAYVPGKTRRHPEGAFDNCKTGVAKGMTELELQDCLAWRAGTLFRARGYYWECHEVLEAVWLAVPEGPLRSYVQAVIQMANAQLKAKMDRPNAVLRLCGIVHGHLDACDGRCMILGQRVTSLREEAIQLAEHIEKKH